MVNVVNCSMNEFLDKSVEKEVIAFGAGRLLKSQYNRIGLKNIKCIVDSDPQKAGTSVEFDSVRVPIVGREKLKELRNSRNAIIITITFAIDTVLEELDSYENLDGMDCYLLPLMLHKDEGQNIAYLNGNMKIPKTIHYCWFGKTEIPQKLKEYMESWKKYCPDYEIIRWDESNYDISKNKYMKEAYESKKWGFVPDYARIDIVYQYGGIYLDTDVEIVKSFDDLLFTSSFMGYTDQHDVALGLGFGAEKGNPLLGDMRNYYEDKRFIKLDGGLDLRMCIEYQLPVLKKWGFQLDGIQEIIEGNAIYPREVFNPLGRFGVNALFTENTHSIHHAEISWESEENRRLYRESIAKIKERIKL